MRLGILLGFLVAAYGTSTHADEYKDTTDAAYCIGVYQSDLENWKDGVQSRFTAGKIADVGQKLFRKQAFVEGAVKQGRLDAGTASKMSTVGYADT